MKRARFGIKHFMLCENTSYTYRFDVYTGAQDEYALLHNQIPVPDSAAHLPKPGKVTVSLCGPVSWIKGIPYIKTIGIHPYHSIPAFTKGEPMCVAP